MDCNAFSVQEYWNHLEQKIIKVVDNLIPLEPFKNNATVKSLKNQFIKHKLNLKKTTKKAEIKQG